MDDLHVKATKRFENIRGDVPQDDLSEIEVGAEERRRLGRYTLEEAAVFIEINGRADARSILTELADAMADLSLNVYRPRSDQIHREIWLSRPWTDEVKWCDLNTWLKINEPDIDVIFPKPATKTTTKPANGMTKNEIITSFRTCQFTKRGDDKSWRNALEEYPKWLHPSRIRKGTKSHNTPSLWNPVAIGIALLSLDEGIPIRKLDTVFVGLKAWQAEWQEKSELYRD